MVTEFTFSSYLTVQYYSPYAPDSKVLTQALWPFHAFGFLCFLSYPMEKKAKVEEKEKQSPYKKWKNQIKAYCSAFPDFTSNR